MKHSYSRKKLMKNWKKNFYKYTNAVQALVTEGSAKWVNS